AGRFTVLRDGPQTGIGRKAAYRVRLAPLLPAVRSGSRSRCALSYAGGVSLGRAADRVAPGELPGSGCIFTLEVRPGPALYCRIESCEAGIDGGGSWPGEDLRRI